jgi:hypothetical protein
MSSLKDLLGADSSSTVSSTVTLLLLLNHQACQPCTADAPMLVNHYQILSSIHVIHLEYRACSSAFVLTLNSSSRARQQNSPSPRAMFPCCQFIELYEVFIPIMER